MRFADERTSGEAIGGVERRAKTVGCVCVIEVGVKTGLGECEFVGAAEGAAEDGAEEAAEEADEGAAEEADEGALDWVL